MYSSSQSQWGLSSNQNDLLGQQERERLARSTTTFNLGGAAGPGSWGSSTNASSAQAVEGAASTFGQSQYAPGYLLSATVNTGSGPSYPAPPLIPESFKRVSTASTSSKFGAEPFATGFKQSVSTATIPSIAFDDDDNAPPSNSMLEGGIATPSSGRTFRNSLAGGFHSSTIGSPYSSTPTTSQSISSPLKNPSIYPTPSTSSIQVIVFGFPPEHYGEIIPSHFLTSPDVGLVEPFDGSRNWVILSYQHAWEAARAVRRNGEIILGSIMIGVRWADPSQVDIETDTTTQHPTQPATSRLPFGTSVSTMSIGKPVIIASSGSAFKHLHSSPSVAAASTGAGGSDWARALTAGGQGASGPNGAQNQQGQAQGQEGSGVLSKLSEIVFGW